MGREWLWKARECHEAKKIYLGGQNIVSAPSMDLDPVWFSTLNELKVFRSKKMNISTMNKSFSQNRLRLCCDDLKTMEDTDPPHRPLYMTRAWRGALHSSHS
jgi:hypothetical protein